MAYDMLWDANVAAKQKLGETNPHSHLSLFCTRTRPSDTFQSKGRADSVLPTIGQTSPIYADFAI